MTAREEVSGAEPRPDRFRATCGPREGSFTNPDVAAEMATPGMRQLWSAETAIQLERELWIVVMKQQQQLGLDIPEWAIEASVAVADQVDLASIERRERVTHHDLKARLEEFCDLAGHQYHHLGMTSADVVDNIMLIRMRRALRRLTVGPADPDLSSVLNRLAFRGISGPVGTHQDQLDLLGSYEACATLDRRVALHFGFSQVMGATGQVYHRSADLDVVSALTRFVARQAPGSPRVALMAGYQSMMASTASSTWNEGDVSQSATRRYAIPAAFMVASGAVPAPPGPKPGPRKREPKPECPTKGKRKFKSEAAALTSIARGGPMFRAYLCPCGKWHLSTRRT